MKANSIFASAVLLMASATLALPAFAYDPVVDGVNSNLDNIMKGFNEAVEAEGAREPVDISSLSCSELYAGAEEYNRVGEYDQFHSSSGVSRQAYEMSGRYSREWRNRCGR